MTRTDAATILRNSIPADCRIGIVYRDYFPEDGAIYWSAEVFNADASESLGSIEFVEGGDDPVIHWR